MDYMVLALVPSTDHGLHAGGLRTAQRRFTEIFPRRFADANYLAWERDYKSDAHRLWHELLPRKEFATLLRKRAFRDVGARAIAVYQRPKLNMLALYEWMALREALVNDRGARLFAPALYELVYGIASYRERFLHFVETLDALPQRQTGMAKWPIATLYPFV